MTEQPTPDSQRQLTRRTMMAGTAAGAAGVGAAAVAGPADADQSRRKPSKLRHFQHGVASGDPLPRRVVIWTRVTPTRAATPGSTKGPNVTVRWEAAKDPHFKHVVRHGEMRTGPYRDHTVKVDVTGLKPATTYYYRFHYEKSTSRVGRLRTAPGRKASPRNLRLAVVSCQNWQAGYFASYRAIAKRDDLHGVLFLGDYIYEYGQGEYGYGMSDTDIRKHDPAHEIVSMEDYRRRHAQYKTDADLQDAHARHTWIITWDDHEVADNAWKNGAVNHQPGTEGDFHGRRHRAHRVYDEWMPVRLDDTAKLGDGTRIYRRFQFGRLAEISLLDLRTYRDKQLAEANMAQVDDPDRSITGKKQLTWLINAFRRRRSLWTVIGNPVMISPITFAGLPQEVVGPINSFTGLLPPNGVPFNTDQWDGYTADRSKVLNFIKNHKVQNAVFVTGDIHSAWVCDVPYDSSTYPISGAAAVEFVGTSITSNNLKDVIGTPARSAPNRAVEAAVLSNNRHIQYLNFDDNGYSVLDLTSKRAQMDYYIVGDRADKNTQLTFSTSWATRTGTNKVYEVGTPVKKG